MSANAETWLFETLLDISAAEEFKRRQAGKVADRAVKRLAGRLHDETFEEAGGAPDLDTLTALFELMPDIQKRLKAPDDDHAQSHILAPTDVSSNSFLSALAIAARGTGRPLRGYCGGISIVATPEGTPGGLIEEYKEQWVKGAAKID